MKTIKLYDEDSHLYNFEAEVISCEKSDDKYIIVLDRTAFFPEGGGQKSDTGFIEKSAVTDVQIRNKIIYHYADSPVEAGQRVKCGIDERRRFRHMQNHSGEHIFSGIAHTLYGCENVGFHLGDEVTVDFDIELNEAQIRRIEAKANEAVCKNLKITAEYPDSKTLSTLDYRSKLELTEDVRIVTVDGIDVCACCAPHVSYTGEIGIIKVLNFMRHRGGVRIFIKCGLDAFEDYCIKCNNLARISTALCAKQNEAADVFDKFSNDTLELKQKLTKLSKELAALKAQSIEDTDGNILLFEDECDMPTLRTAVLDGAKHAGGICAGFSGNDKNGYIYVASSQNIKLRAMSKEINTVLNGKGGGSDELIQGSVKATRTEIEKYFSEV
ncbi:MAG: alanine--tRNA ligase-related protein [Clostridia bacterium]|nr:alanine--tRNA ligase-related protein [Clostridia bacterium]